MTMSRRHFVTGCAAGLAGTMGMAFARPLPWKNLPRKIDAVEPLGSARNLIFILLDGAPSHVDTFDLKTGFWTPDSLGPASLKPGMDWPVGIMPKLAERHEMFSVVRSLTAVEAVHERAVYHLLTAHRQNAGTQAEVPHLASVLSYKLHEQRQAHHTLPGVVIFGRNPVHNGFLPIDHLGMLVDQSGSIPNMSHNYEGENARFELLSGLLGHDPAHGAQNNRATFLNQARTMMTDPDLKRLLPEAPDSGVLDPGFIFDNADVFVQQCDTAVNFLAADKGVRVLQLVLSNWDHHFDIYQPGVLDRMARALDDGMAHLLDRLSQMPGLDGGSLLDETLIVAAGEFGRTVGNLNTSDGRDHYPNAMSALLAGGGVKGGRVIGNTNHDGGIITDPGWSHNRFMTINDLVASIYNAMGVDWTERMLDTPSGRVFELLDSNIAGPLHPIDQLFV